MVGARSDPLALVLRCPSTSLGNHWTLGLRVTGQEEGSCAQVGTQAGFVQGFMIGSVYFIFFCAYALALWYGSVRIIACLAES